MQHAPGSRVPLRMQKSYRQWQQIVQISKLRTKNMMTDNNGTKLHRDDVERSAARRLVVQYPPEQLAMMVAMSMTSKKLKFYATDTDGNFYLPPSRKWGR